MVKRKKSVLFQLDPFWAGTESALHQFLDAVEKVHFASPADWQALKQMAFAPAHEEDEDEFGELAHMVQVGNGVGVINIEGSLIPQSTWLSRIFGMTGYDEIRDAASLLNAREDVSKILLNVSSPGGAVTGVSQTAEHLRTIDAQGKPIYTYAGDIMASGGYWLGSVGRRIEAGDMAQVGSIGVIAVHQEVTKMLRERGITATVLREGEYKALGNPYEPLDTKAKETLQADLHTIWQGFARTVAQNLRISIGEAERLADGRVYRGEAAVRAGLVHGISTLDEVLQRLSDGAGSHVPMTAPRGGQIDMKLNARQKAALEAGVSLEQVLADPELAQEEAEAEVAADAGTEVAGEEVAGEEAEAEAEVAADAGTEEAETESPAAGASFDRLFARIDTEIEKRVAAEEEARGLRTQLGKLESSMSGLCDIAKSAAGRMQVALGGAPLTLSDDPATLIDQFYSVQTAFNKRFPAGAQAQVPEEEDLAGVSRKEDSVAGSAHFKAARISKKAK